MAGVEVCGIRIAMSVVGVGKRVRWHARTDGCLASGAWKDPKEGRKPEGRTTEGRTPEGRRRCSLREV